MSRPRAVSVVGIGDDGCKSLSARALEAVMAATWLVGGERHLAFFPQFRGERLVLKSGVGAALDRVAELCGEHNVCVLASGDPLFFGVGALVVARIGAAHVEIIPQPSSVQWAFARAGLKWDDARFLSLHGRPRVGLVARIRDAAKVALLTDDRNTPAVIARHLLDYNESAWRATVCENVCGLDERVRAFDLETLAATIDIAPLNVLLLERTGAWRASSTVPFMHEDDFAKRIPKKGLITKREVRLLSLASLRIRPDAVVWDIGAGSGSVAIEAARLVPEGRVYAIEVDPEGVEICLDNVRRHGADNVEVVAGRAPEALAALQEAPEAVFVGGSQGSLDVIIETVLDRLVPGGRLVVNAITLENAAEAYQAFRKRGLVPEVTLLQVSRGEPLARYLRYEALNPIQIFAVTKPEAA